MSYRKPRSTQRNRRSTADGHVPRSPAPHDPHRAGAEPGRLRDTPTADNYPVHWGPRVNRTGEDNKRLTNITNERARGNPHPLAKRMTKFITNMRGQVRIPVDVVGGRGTFVPGGVKCLEEIYRIPED